MTLALIVFNVCSFALCLYLIWEVALIQFIIFKLKDKKRLYAVWDKVLERNDFEACFACANLSQEYTDVMELFETWINFRKTVNLRETNRKFENILKKAESLIKPKLKVMK